MRRAKLRTWVYIAIPIVTIGLMYACDEPEERIVHEDYVMDELQVEYQNGDIDTIEVKRNSMVPYSFQDGNLKVFAMPYEENTIYIGGYDVVKCGVRDYHILNSKEIK